VTREQFRLAFGDLREMAFQCFSDASVKCTSGFAQQRAVAGITKRLWELGFGGARRSFEARRPVSHKDRKSSGNLALNPAVWASAAESFHLASAGSC
jgi:hypothetical protein